MSRLIHDYFDAIEARFIASPIVVAFDVIQREVTPADGKIRIRAKLADGGPKDGLSGVVTWDRKRGKYEARDY